MKTLPKQISLFEEEKLTSSQEDSHVSHIQQLEKEKEKKMNAIYGQRCLEQLEKFNRPGLWAKTFSGLLIGMGDWFSKRCNLSWKLKGTPYKRLYFQLQVLAHRTKDTEFGSLPTPVASDAGAGAIIGENDTFRITSTGMPRKINQNGTDGSVGLARLGKLGMLPTPRSRAAGGDVNNNRNKRNLEDKIAELLPTATTRDYKGARTSEALEKAGRTKTNSLPDYFSQTGKSSQLSPLFVMEMMGFPPDWTLRPFSKSTGRRSRRRSITSIGGVLNR